MRILAGFEQPDSGDVSSTRLNLRTGYLAQGMDFTPEQTLQSALGLDPTTQTDPAAEVESLATALSITPNDSALQQEYDEALARLSTFDLRPANRKVHGPQSSVGDGTKPSSRTDD